MVQFEDEYVGYKLFATKTGEEIFSFEFDIVVMCSELNHSDISANCLQVWGKPCEDGKMQAAVHGLSTTGSTYSCPICTYHIGDKIVSSWVNNCGSNNNEIEVEFCRDYEKRVRDISLEKSHIFKISKQEEKDALIMLIFI